MADHPKTGAGSERRIKEAKRAEQAVGLRLMRTSYAEIAQRLGYKDESGARKVITRMLAKTRRLTLESAEEIRQLDLAKLDDLEMRLTAIVRGIPATTPIAKVQASRSIVYIMKRRADLLGLDAALEVNHNMGDSAKMIEDRRRIYAAMTEEELEITERLWNAAKARADAAPMPPAPIASPAVSTEEEEDDDGEA